MAVSKIVQPYFFYSQKFAIVIFFLPIVVGAKGLSKRELSRLANISDTELARIESGKREMPNPKTLRKISQYIDVNYNNIMYVAD